MKRAVLWLMIAVCSIAGAYSIDEIRELKRLGFTNEQIVEMSKARAGGGVQTGVVASATAAPSATPEMVATFQKLADRNEGLLVLCFTKDWMNRGPGYLHVDRLETNGKWVPVGKLNIMEYSTDGRTTPPIFEHVKFDHRWAHACTITHEREIITSRYYAEFPLPKGSYEIKIERQFNTGDKEDSGLIRLQRHKIFHAAGILPGKATVLSYFWQENQQFGIDHVMSVTHQDFIQYVTGQLGEFLHEVKVQHEK